MEKPLLRFCVLNLILVLCLVSCSGTKRQEKNLNIEKIASEVTLSKIESTISDMEEFGTRYPHEKQLADADYLFKRLKEYNSRVEFHEYEYCGVDWKNVVGTIRGMKNPEQCVIVCAHLDSKSAERFVYAPGADDNASGCAAVLELARILSGHSFGKTIKFIFFSREETGQNGSKAYLKSIDRSKEQIVAALNLDMIAYGSDNEDVDLVTRPKYSWLAKKIDMLAKVYGFDTKKVIRKDCY